MYQPGYTLACPHCGHRVLKVVGTCSIDFTGTLDCTDFDTEAEIEMDYFSTVSMDVRDEQIKRLSCTSCGKNCHNEAASKAYAEAYEEYLSTKPDPRQLTMFTA